MLGQVGLEQHPPRSLAPPGAARDLVEQLEGALGRAQIAALEAEIGIDHADQGQHGKVMAFGQHLGADDQIDLARRDLLDQLGRGLRPGQGVARGDQDPCVGKAGGDFLGEALDAGAAGGEARLCAAIGAGWRKAAAKAAMMALQAPGLAVLDQPRGAIGAGQPVAAGAAQGQRRVAPPVKEQ